VGRGSGSGQGSVGEEVSESRGAGRLSRSRRGSGSHGRTGVRRGKEGGMGKKTGGESGTSCARSAVGVAEQINRTVTAFVGQG
jgi:hypothetical protein